LLRLGAAAGIAVAGIGLGVAAPARSGTQTRAAAAVPGQVLVRFEPGTSAARRAAARAHAGTRVVRRLPVPGMELERTRGVSVTTAVARLADRPGVASAEPNHVLQAASAPCPGTLSNGRCVPNDPRFGDLWRLDNTGQSVSGKVGVADADIDAPEAWATTQGSDRVTIAIVDTGIAADHPDLAPNIWTNPGEIPGNGLDDDNNGFKDDVHGWDFADNDNDTRDLNGHGTHVAGIAGAAGNNGIGTTGVSWNSKLMPVRVLGYRYGTTAAEVAAGFEYAADNGAKIVNLSYGMDQDSPAIESVIHDHPDVLFTVAAGNNPAVDLDAPGNDQFPCESPEPNVVCVASTDSNDTKSSFSKWGGTSVDLGAPGNYAFSTVPARATAWANHFESPTSGLPEGWSTSQAAGSPASTWGVTSAYHAPNDGVQSVTDSPSGPYTTGSNSWIENTDTINLANKQGCRLSYALKLDAPSPDRFYIQARRDGNFATYAPGDPDEVSVASDTADGVTVRQEDVSALDGAPSAHLRLGLLAQPSATANTHDGASVDMVRIQCLTGTYAGGGNSEVELMAGTSMASPLVAGTAALVWSAYPDFTVAQVKKAILDGTDRVPSLDHKTVSGGRLNAAGALAAADRILNPPPVTPAGSGTSTVVAKPTPAPAVAAPAKPATTCKAKASVTKKKATHKKHKKHKKKKRKKQAAKKKSCA
jgi:thermitase